MAAKLSEDDKLEADRRQSLGLHLVSLGGFADWYEYNPKPRGNDSRDEAMARIFLEQWRSLYPEQRVVMSAHSLHLNTASDSIETVSPRPLQVLGLWEDTVRMGNHLARELGDDYYPISLVVWQHDDVRPLSRRKLRGDPPILEANLHELGEPLLLVDLGTYDPGLTRIQIPLGPKTVVQLQTEISRNFRALVFIDQAEIARELP